MAPLARKLLAAAIATSMLLPVTAIAAPSDGKKAATSSKKKQTSKQRWRGYGFLPGYRQPPALTDWKLRSSRKRAPYTRYEPRYLSYWPYSGYSQLQYGWGSPGVYRGRWNGGSFGPCWTTTPIGMMWNCEQ